MSEKFADEWCGPTGIVEPPREEDLWKPCPKCGELRFVEYSNLARAHVGPSICRPCGVVFKYRRYDKQTINWIKPIKKKHESASE
jgi:predicted RNA-binding Zn-ribbon protein involved in translation (DUF1610 family)